MIIQYQLKSKFFPYIDVFFNDHYCSSDKTFTLLCKDLQPSSKIGLYRWTIFCENLTLCL